MYVLRCPNLSSEKHAASVTYRAVLRKTKRVQGLAKTAWPELLIKWSWVRVPAGSPFKLLIFYMIFERILRQIYPRLGLVYHVRTKVSEPIAEGRDGRPRASSVPSRRRTLECSSPVIVYGELNR
jgi:hypothetical protein